MSKTEQVIEACKRAVGQGASVHFVRQALAIDGFKADKAEVIIRWAIQSTKNHGNLSSVSMGNR